MDDSTEVIERETISPGDELVLFEDEELECIPLRDEDDSPNTDVDGDRRISLEGVVSDVLYTQR
jgi:hypothetical protein